MDSVLDRIAALGGPEPLDRLQKAIVTYDVELARQEAKAVIAAGLGPNEALDAMTEAIRLVGDGFEARELWLPDLIGAADAMQSAMPIIEAEIERAGTSREAAGKVVIGTVAGDLHSIGKTMVAALLQADGFEVIDLGVDVPSAEFVEATVEQDADLLAMSTLLTTTVVELGRVIDGLREKGVRQRVKVMVGGAAVTDDFAAKVGADGYDPTAVGAVRLANELMGR